MSNGGSDVPGQIRANAAATKPADPTRSGYVFAGWYTDEACTAAYDFTQPVTDSVTLYAKWEAAPRYYYNSGTTTDTDNADEDKKGSPKTFDPGVGIYAVMAALSLTGTAAIGTHIPYASLQSPFGLSFFAYSQMCIQTSQAPQMTLRRLPHFSQVPTR